MSTHHRATPKVIALGSFDRLAHPAVNQMELLRLHLYHLAIVGEDNWTVGAANSSVFEAANDLLEYNLSTPAGDPAMQNIEWLRRQGWRVDIVHSHDKKHGAFWYGKLYVWGPYHLTFNWCGQESVGV